MIELHNITLHQDEIKVLSDLSCEFQNGQFWGVIGQNGVGKSTLLRAMAGLKTPVAGSVLVDGLNMSHMDPVSRAQKTSYLLQDQEPCLAFDVWDAVGMGRFPWPSTRQQDAQITQQILTQCRINQLAERSILKLSGGERRKVEIATCLAQQADHLLLDEPLNHLDLVYRHHIMQVFKDYSQQHCVIMVCHDIEVVKQHCSHVLMLLANDCYLAGTSATMLNQHNLDRLFNDLSQSNKK